MRFSLFSVLKKNWALKDININSGVVTKEKFIKFEYIPKSYDRLFGNC